MWTECGVYLPKGYDAPENAERRYPLVVWLHGMNGDWSQFHDNGAAALDRARGEGKFPDLIFAAPSAGRRSLYLNGERGGDYEDLIARDLVGELERRFRVSDKRQDRVLMGCSIGGTGALKIAFKHPEIFGAVASHSGAIFPVDPKDIPARYDRQRQFMNQQLGLAEILGDPIDEKKWAVEMPMAMIAHMQPDDLKGMRIWVDAGADDRYGFGPPNQELHQLLRERGFAHEFELLDGVGHAWGDGQVDQRLVRALAYAAAGFSAR